MQDVAQQTKVNQGNPPFKQTKWQNAHDYLISRRKDLWQNWTHIHDKSPLRLKDPRDIPQHNKGSFNKHIANNKLSGEKLKAILLKSGIGQGCPLSQHIQYSTWSSN